MLSFCGLPDIMHIHLHICIHTPAYTCAGMCKDTLTHTHTHMQFEILTSWKSPSVEACSLQLPLLLQKTSLSEEGFEIYLRKQVITQCKGDTNSALKLWDSNAGSSSRCKSWHVQSALDELPHPEACTRHPSYVAEWPVEFTFLSPQTNDNVDVAKEKLSKTNTPSCGMTSSHSVPLRWRRTNSLEAFPDYL